MIVVGDKLARVTSIGQVMVIGACAIGPFLGGSAIQGMGVRGAAIAFSFLCLVLMGVAVKFRVPGISARMTGIASPERSPRPEIPARKHRKLSRGRHPASRSRDGFRHSAKFLRSPK